MRHSRKTVLIILTVAIALSLIVSVAVAAPPASAGGRGRGNSGRPLGIGSNGESDDSTWVPPGLRDKGIPPGLQDKGGLPPGLVGRDVLPPGIMMRFSDALEGDDEGESEDGALVIDGPDAVAIPLEGSTTARYEATCPVHDEGVIEWDIDGEVAGVAIDQDGILTVSNEAEDRTIEILAGCQYEDEGNISEHSATIAVALYLPEASGIEILGPDFIRLSDQEGDAEQTVSYEARVFDQMGMVVESSPPDWAIESEDFDFGEDGYSVDGDQLEVRIPETPGVFTVTATSSDLDTTITVQVYRGIPESLEIVGESYVTVDEEDLDGGLQLQYSARIVDERGFPMEGFDFDWRLESDHTDIGFEDGTVSIGSIGSDEISFVLTVSKDDLDMEDSIVVLVYSPIPREVRISGPDTIEISEDDEEVSASYSAEVLDQHGQDLGGVTVVWLLGEEGEGYDGVSWDSDGGHLIVSGESEVESVDLRAIVNEEVHDVKTVSIERTNTTEE